MYTLSLTLFQWSLLYLLVLFFLEDSRPFLVLSVFSPHWLIVVVIVAAIGVLLYAAHGQQDTQSKKRIVTALDRWVATTVAAISCIALMSVLWSRISFWAVIFSAIVFFVSKKMSLLLINEKTKLPSSLRLMMPTWVKKVQQINDTHN